MASGRVPTMMAISFMARCERGSVSGDVSCYTCFYSSDIISVNASQRKEEISRFRGAEGAEVGPGLHLIQVEVDGAVRRHDPGQVL